MPSTTRGRECGPKGEVARIAIVAGVLAALSPAMLAGGWSLSFFSNAYSSEDLLGPAVATAILGAGTATVGIVSSVRRRDRRNMGVCGAALLTTLVFIFWLCCQMYLAQRWGNVFYSLKHVHVAVWEFWEIEGRAPRNVEELVRAGLLREDVPFLDRFVLAPLDGRFFYGQDSGNAFSAEFLCAYSTLEVEKGSSNWMYIDLGYRARHASPSEVQRWIADQRDAIAWLDDTVPLMALKQIAEGGESRRARMAAGILKYRQAKAGREGRQAEDASR